MNNLIQRPARGCTLKDGTFNLIGLRNHLMARCECGCCQKVLIESLKKHYTLYCPCGSILRVSDEFLDLWNSVRIRLHIWDKA